MHIKIRGNKSLISKISIQKSPKSGSINETHFMTPFKIGCRNNYNFTFYRPNKFNEIFRRKKYLNSFLEVLCSRELNLDKMIVATKIDSANITDKWTEDEKYKLYSTVLKKIIHQITRLNVTIFRKFSKIDC